MHKTTVTLIALLSFSLASLLVSPTAKSAAEFGDFEALYGDEKFISIATGSKKAITIAPAVATVITAEDIAAIGADDLDEALETVPGLHVSHYITAYTHIYNIRGIRSDTNPQVLVLINGIPTTNLFFGDSGRFWGGMPVKAISRIEIIRGPGSALYGADAYAGVINIVTKNSEDIDGTYAGGHVGSFDTHRAWLLHGRKLGAFNAAFALEVGTTEGHSRTIPVDAQSGLDAIISANDPNYEPASLAPGPVNLGRDNLDARLEISNDRWRFRTGYQGRFRVESGAGAAGALDPASRYKSERINADITYNNPNLSKNWNITFLASFLHASQEFEDPFVLFPPGADFTLIGGGGPFVDGVIGSPEVFERHYRLGFSTFYTGLRSHHIHLGSGWELGDLYEVGDLRNFLSNTFGLPIPHPTDLTNVSDTSEAFLPEEKRTVYYAFAQDEWTIARDWEFTSGIRYDHYSDFGETINPRLALVWQTAYNITSKLLYGRAFRAPAFAELHNRNNPVALGNPDLEPEIIDTVELAFDYRPTGNFRGALSLFSYRMKDIIQLVADPEPATSSTFQNAGRQKGRGFELEGEWKLAQNFTLIGNFSYQHSTDESSDSNAGFAPQRQLYMRADWRLAPAWKLHSQLNWVMDREREPEDTRQKVDDYTLIDLTLRRTHDAGSKWSLAFSVRNALDEKAAEPVPAAIGIPEDLPLAGRNFYFEAEHSF